MGLSGPWDKKATHVKECLKKFEWDNNDYIVLLVKIKITCELTQNIVRSWSVI